MLLVFNYLLFSFYCSLSSFVGLAVTAAAETSSSSASTTKAKSIPLAQSTFAEVTSGKTVFIKWYAPWCGHCQALAPVWELLASNFHSEQGLIAEVDCTVEEDWCISMGITAFPTLTYGETSYDGVFLEEYDDDTSFKNLSEFVQKTLHSPFCSPGNIDACDEEMQKTIATYWDMPINELRIAIQNEEDILKDAEQKFQKAARVLQTDYDDIAKIYESETAKLKRQIKLYNELIDVLEVSPEKEESSETS